MVSVAGCLFHAQVKYRTDYAKEREPRSACLKDIVRCMLVFPDANKLLAGFEDITENFEVVNVKNTFADTDPPFG